METTPAESTSDRAYEAPLQAATTTPSAQVGDISFARLIGTSTGIKLAVDTSVQLFNPFLAIIAGGLGTTVVGMGMLVSLRSIMGLFAPLFGAHSDRVGYRRTIRLALLLNAVGILIVGLSPSVFVAAVGMIVMGLGTGSFVPMLHAYLSGKLSYSRRARSGHRRVLLGAGRDIWAVDHGLDHCRCELARSHADPECCALRRRVGLLAHARRAPSPAPTA